MDDRLGFVVSSLDQLSARIQAYLDGEQEIEDTFHGQIRNHQDTLAIFKGDADFQETLDRWMGRRNLSKLLDVWVKGVEVSWSRLYGDIKPRRVSLPTYPFAREKYWVDTVGQIVASASSGRKTTTASVLHPLLHTNISDLQGQLYHSTFSGEEPFLLDRDTGGGQKVLPELAYLEMARVAIDQATGTRRDSGILELRQVIWGQPLVVSAEKELTLSLFETESGEIDYEVFSSYEGQESVHCQGQAILNRQPTPAALDLLQLKARMRQGDVDVAGLYAKLSAKGLHYSQAHQGIVSIQRGSHELLAELSVPTPADPADVAYALHPTLMEGVSQAGSALLEDLPRALNRPTSPMSLDSLRVIAPCERRMFAWIRHSPGSGADSKVGKLDVDLCDPQGNCSIQLRGLSLQETAAEHARVPAEKLPEPAAAASHTGKSHSVQLVSLQPVEAPVSRAAAERNGVTLVGLDEVSSAATDALEISRPASEPIPASEPKPASVSAPVLSLQQLHRQLKESLAGALYMEAAEIESDKPFVDLGLDSIVGVEWVKIINKQFGLSISATRLYDYSNIEALGAFLSKEIAKSPAPEPLPQPREPTPPATETPVRNSPPSVETTRPALRRKSRIGRAARGNTVSAPVAEPARVADTRGSGKIAVVGMSGRYPQANDLRQYWENLAQGRNSIVEIPASRWDVGQYYDRDPSRKGTVYCKWLGMLDDAESFDPLFFQISPAEAENMDPQHRLFMQEAYRAFEDAGYSNRTLSNSKCGVYLGIMSNEYSLLLSRSGAANVDTTGTSYAIGAARIAYYLNLKGPAIPIDTACSSSLVAIHLACQALQNREIDLALAGGVTLYLTPDSYLGMCQAGMLSPDGQCKTFDDSADGFVPGEGVGAVVLKRLEDAERDHDEIHGVILASGINQDGKTNGITAPSVNSQIELERDLYARHQIDPQTIGYVEAHGTGTKLGDPIELEALATVFSEKTARKNFCALGSVKTNIGHTSGAAGVASVQKVLLSMRHQTLVPSLNVTKENTLFDFGGSPFYICREKQAWNVAANSPRRAAVSSFGFSGTNAHLVIEEYSPPASEQVATAPESNTDFAIVLSARTQAQLQQKARDLLDFVVREQPTAPVDLAALAYTLQWGREPLKERIGFVVSSIAQLAERLQAYIAGERNIESSYIGQVAKNQEALSLFSSDTDLQATVEKWMTQRKLSSLLAWWVKGLELDWTGLYGAARPRRLRLPTYPFAKERYWVTSPAQSAPVIAQSRGEGESQRGQGGVESPRRLHFRPDWKVSAIDASESNSGLSGPILILDAAQELFLQLREKGTGRQSESTFLLVKPGASYCEVAPNIFSLNFEQQEHWRQLVGELAVRQQLPRQVIHQCLDSSDLSAALNQGIYALFQLCKALLLQKHHATVRILSLFTSSPVRTAPEHAALGGFAKTLMLENPQYQARVVEVRSLRGNMPISAAETADIVLDELRDRDWRATEIRYLGRVRHVKELVSFDAGDLGSGPLPLKQNGVYVVTGGLGGLGFLLSEYLVKTSNARLVLLGRSSPTKAQQEKLLSLRAHQPQVLYLQVDVSKLPEVERAIGEAKARFACINGVIHAAGVHQDSFILTKTRQEMEAVLAAKLHGSLNLDQATSAEDLDFFAMFSSVAGVLGNAGQSDYAYGNHFLDSFAESRDGLRAQRQRAGRTLSINWPFWREGGMRLSAEDLARAEAQSGLSPLPTTEGIRYWEEFLRSDLAQGIALYGMPSRIQASLAGQSAHRGPRAPAAIMDTANLPQQTQGYLRGLIGREIKLAPEQIDPQERFESFGIDSIVVSRLNTQLAHDLGELPKTLFYQYATIDELAQHLIETAREALSCLFGPKDPVVADAQSEVGPEIENAPAEKTASTKTPQESEPIAIIGLHGFYPRSTDLGQFWENLQRGKDLVGLVPTSRWDVGALYHPDPDKATEGKIYCKWGAFLEDIDRFDPQFFNIPAAEARAIDPQERLFLASVWAAIEDAGYTRESLKRLFPKGRSADVGVFVGVTTNSYQLLATEEWSRGNLTSPSAFPWSIANRVSYFFDFQGPSLPIDTACSSSLVAIHLACESLNKGDCQVAIAGGVNLYLHPAKYHSFCERRMLARAGRCRSFGAGDDGFVPGEAVGTLVLKPLSKALEHRDHIHAVIAGSGFEHAGRSNGYAAPNPNSQAALISRTLIQANIHPDSIGYIEGHGTGTQLGDSLEIVALTQAFRKQTDKRGFCAVGSLKSNAGHSESAAGVAGVTKIILQMQHQQLVPTLHSDEVNPDIELEDSPFYLQHALAPWPSLPSQPRRALINSFGAGGVNACLILEEPGTQAAPVRAQEVGPHLIVLSARTEDRLRACVNQLLAHLQAADTVDLLDLSYTLQVGREGMSERLAIVASDVNELLRKLGEWSQRGNSGVFHRGSLDPRRGSRRASSQSEERLQRLFEARDLEKLAAAWVAGEDVDWQRLYSRSAPRRISLPTYSFAKERHWISDGPPSPKRAFAASPNLQLHPLISHNSSTLNEVSFSSLLSKREFYAQDHRVGDQMVFPGAGFLEIACVSAALAGGKEVRRIQDVVWVQPLVFWEESQMIQISLKSVEGGAEYLITSLDEDHERLVHSEGIVYFRSDVAHSVTSEETIDIGRLREQCSTTVDCARYYALFEKASIQYGPAFRTMQELSVGKSCALAKLGIAEAVRANFSEFILHPCVLDGALQTASALIGELEAATPCLPFAIGEVEITGSPSESSYVYVEAVPSEGKSGADVRKFNIKIASLTGRVLVNIKDFCVRAAEYRAEGVRAGLR
jgi:acyl transferase domain-containing protein